MKHQPSITSLPTSPDADRRGRMIKYTVAMSIRVVCLVSLLFVPFPWLFIPAAGAIFLPYFAVVIANVSNSQSGSVERPGTVVRIDKPATQSDSDGADGAERADGKGSDE